jgi:hypothetical protein
MSTPNYADNIHSEKDEIKVDHLEDGVVDGAPPVHYDPKIAKSAIRKVSQVLFQSSRKRVKHVQMDVVVMPLIVIMYLFSSLDKSNLGNARTLGMMNDIGSDPKGETYALLNSMYFVAYAPFSEYIMMIPRDMRLI